LTRRSASEKRYEIDKHGYGHAIGWCLYDAYNIGLKVVGDDTIQTVIDRREGFYAVAHKNWKAIVGMMKPTDAARIETPVKGDSALLYPLQAADLLAYETRGEVWHRFDDWPISHALNRLVRTNHHQARVLTLELAHSGKVKTLGDTPYLYRPGMHVRSRLLWHGEHWQPAKTGQQFDRRGLPVSGTNDASLEET
jgi:hypothetical protein